MAGRSDLETSVDQAIEHLWPEGEQETGGWTLEFIAAMMRAAYGQGYVNALASSAPLSPEAAEMQLEYLWKRLPAE